MKTFRRIFVLLTLSIILTGMALSQTGPGGVGSSTDNTLWLVGDDMSTITFNVANVSQWSDKSGNANHATQATASKQPGLLVGVINSRTAVSFDGVNDRFDLPANSVLTNNAPFALFAVIQPLTINTYLTIFSAGVNAPYVAFIKMNNRIYFSDNSNASMTITGSTPLSAGFEYLYYAEASSSVSLSLNGVSDATPVALTTAAIPHGERSVGGPSSGYATWSGEIGEIIVYNRALNSAERTIVASYLNAKWAVAPSVNKYGGSSSYSEGVVGIGQESDGSSWVGGGEGIVMTNSVGSSANGEYLMAGHNSGANSVVTTDVPATVTHRWSRVWYLDKTGTFDVIDFRIGFDFSASGIGGTPTAASNYRLLYRASTSGNFATVPLTFTQIVGDVVNFDVSSSDLPDGYYTIGSTNEPSSPLPVQMSSLTAVAHISGAELKWSTETELDNYGFEIERQQTRNPNSETPNWSNVGFVAGAGTSSSRHEYSFIDGELSSGQYAYRIKQINKDGSFNYTGEVDIEVGVAPKEFNLFQNYPNPFNPSTTIEFSVPGDGHAVLKVIDLLGREVATLFDGEAQSGLYQHIVFDASKLASGLYFAKMQQGEKRQLIKMLLMK